jgi:hypothetical protein
MRNSSAVRIPAIVFVIGFVAVLSIIAVLIFSESPAEPEYLSPRVDAPHVSQGATIAVRYGPVVNQTDLENLDFEVRGEQSGLHAGQTILADDQHTVIFKPEESFTPGEQVQVDISSLRLNGTTYQALSYTFDVGVNQQSWSPEQPSDEDLPRMEIAFPGYLTLPEDIPNFSVTAEPEKTAEGLIFVAPLQWIHTDIGSYLLILDNEGEIVYYQSAADDIAAYDFKVQPNGLISYYSQDDAAYHLMDSHYQIVDSYRAGNGYRADLHEFQVLPNGNVLLMVYDSMQVDLSPYVEGGRDDAQVIALVIQEIDPSKNVVFEWRSWDHMQFSDSPVSLVPEEEDTDIDYVHGNSLEVDPDGNIILSSRNTHEVTKINRETGEIMWRMGGKANQFEFVNDEPFGHQHDARVLENGNITIFDNLGKPGPSRGVEYEVDTEQMTVTKVWEFAHNPPVFAAFMGNAQRLPNGNTLLSWGAPSRDEEFHYANITEVTPENEPVFDLAFDPPFVSYRAFRFPWQGFPTTRPELAFELNDDALTLGYSWNGATEVAGYKVFGGSSAQPDELIEEKEREGFETQTVLNDLPEG